MNPHMDLPLPLLLAITVFFWLLTQAWALFIFWAEDCATRPSVRPASEAGPAGKEHKTP